MLLRNGKEYTIIMEKDGDLFINVGDSSFPPHLQEYKPFCDGNGCCGKITIVCHMCGIERCNDHMDGFSAECSCCHKDFCDICVDILDNRDDHMCDINLATFVVSIVNQGAIRELMTALAVMMRKSQCSHRQKRCRRTTR